MKRCPSCKSSDVTLQIGFEIGNYQCKSCGYVGRLILDYGKSKRKKSKEVLDDMKKHIKNNKL